MNLTEIKAKFKHKAKADLKDLDIALKALPFLVREIEFLEAEIEEHKTRIQHLTKQLKRRPPLEKNGRRDKAEWNAYVDEKNNRLIIRIIGELNYYSAKTASNSVLMVLPNLRDGFDVINDLSGLTKYDNRSVFHLRKLFYTLEKAGLRRTVRLTNKYFPDLFQLLNGTNKSSDQKVALANSIEEAQSMLDNIGRFLKV